MNNRLQRVMIMAGGTGGHVFPGLAVARYLRSQQVEVHWLGTEKGLEARVVPQENFPIHYINIGGLRGKGIKTLFFAPYKIALAVFKARKIILEVKPDVIIGMGGFVSGPGGFASWLMGCPLVIHEQNAKPGLTNKLLARFAKFILAGFPHTFPATRNVITLGNPIRTEIENLPPPQDRFRESNKPFNLLVLGGSLGAQALNELVPLAIAAMNPLERPIILHQTGDKYAVLTQEAYKSYGINIKVQPFIYKIEEAYAWADLVICRSGALTVSELCSVGLGAIFIPFPYATDDHQTTNASFMVDHQAALCFKQENLTKDQLASVLTLLGRSPQERLSMAKAAYALRQVKVSEKIYKVLCDAAIGKPYLSKRSSVQ